MEKRETRNETKEERPLRSKRKDKRPLYSKRKDARDETEFSNLLIINPQSQTAIINPPYQIFQSSNN